MSLQELNDTIALQLGRLYIENQALRAKIAELTAKLAENQKEV